MALKPLSKHELFVSKVKKKMKEIDLLIHDYEATLPTKNRSTKSKGVFIDPETGEKIKYNSKGRGNHGG